MPESLAPMRHAFTAFLVALDVPPHKRVDILTAVGETLSNAVEHAYRDVAIGTVALSALCASDGMLTVDVIDHGSFLTPQQRLFRGFGLRIVRSVAESVDVNTDAGTTVRMIFNAECGRGKDLAV